MNLPKAKSQRVEDLEEIYGFLRQSHISDKNLARLRVLAESADEEVARLAVAVREVAEVRQYKRKRIKFLAREHRALFVKLRESGLLDFIRPY